MDVDITINETQRANTIFFQHFRKSEKGYLHAYLSAENAPEYSNSKNKGKPLKTGNLCYNDVQI